MESQADASWTLESSVELAKQLEKVGAAYVHVSSGGLHEKQHIDIEPNYQVPFAAEIKPVTVMETTDAGESFEGSGHQNQPQQHPVHQPHGHQCQLLRGR
jgi:2,4-dienoyl-CoA reductase-like NADH-dependent reductase (Old Yellow Enzyme family)